jgi:hypothetical protein
MADYPMFRIITHSNNNDLAHLLEVDSTGSTIFKAEERDLILIRESELSRRPLHLFVTTQYIADPAWSESDFTYFDSDSQIFTSIEKFNRSYDNGGVITYN